MRPAVWASRFPWRTAVAVAVLLAIGCLGIARCEELADGTGRYLRQQIVWSAMAVAAMLALSLPNYRVLYRWAYPLYVLSLVALAAAYFFPPINGAHRWIRVGSLGLQPSEFAKIAFVLALSRYLMYSENHRRLRGLVLPLALSLAPVLLILKEPDLGTAVLFLPVLVVMLLTAGARRIDLARLAVAGLLLVPVLWVQMSREQKSRITALFEQPSAQQRPADDAYQLYQAKRMLSLGGGWGSIVLGRLTEDPGAYQLPEARSDFIFCVLGERLGLVGLLMIMGLFAWLVWQGADVAASTREPFGRLLAAGVAALIGSEVLVNTAMNLGLAPVTGVSLPLVSYGGSGLLAHGIALGLLCNVGLRPGYEMTAEPFRWRAG